MIEHRSRTVSHEEGRTLKTRGSVPWAAVLGALFVAAWAWRLSYLARLKASPFWGSLHADAELYWGWATALLQHDFRGTQPFFLGPLYPYLLAALRGVLGDSVGAILLVQTLWGAAAVVLLADAARRLTTPLFGALVGVLIAFYEMAVFFDGLILMETLLFCLESLLLWLVVRANAHPPGLGWMAVLGLLIGVLAQGRATAVLLLIPAALCLGSVANRSRGAAARVAVLVGACLLVAVPGVVHHRIVAREWIPFTYSLGYNLVVGNNPEATGSFMVPAGIMAPLKTGDGRQVQGRDLSPAQSSRYWTDRALGFVKEQPARALRLTGQKLLMLWNRREYAQVESIEVFRAAAGPVGLPVLGTFAFLAILAFAGARPAWGKGRAGRFVVGYVLTTTAAIVPFFVVDRYRLHLVPGVALLAGIGLEALVRRARAGGLWRLAPALLLGALVVALPMPGHDRARQAWNTASDLGGRWLEKGRPDLALTELEKAIQIDHAGRLPGAETATARLDRAEVYGDYATTLMQLRRPAEAAIAYERAYELAPDPARGLALAAAYAVTGSADRSRALYARLGLSGDGALLRAAANADQAGRTSEVESLLEAAIALDSTRTIAWIPLVRLHVQQERFDHAERTLRRAKNAGLNEPAFHTHQALIAAARGDLAGARGALMRVPPAAEASDPSLTPVLEYVRARLASADAR